MQFPGVAGDRCGLGEHHPMVVIGIQPDTRVRAPLVEAAQVPDTTSSYGVANVARASMKYEPAARSNVTFSMQFPFVQFVSVAVLLSAPVPTFGLTVTLTVVPVGTPKVENTTAAEPGMGSTMSTAPKTPCGLGGTGWPATDVMATVGLRTLTTGPGPGVRAASGSVLDTGNVFVNASMRMAP